MVEKAKRGVNESVLRKVSYLSLTAVGILWEASLNAELVGLKLTPSGMLAGGLELATFVSFLSGLGAGFTVLESLPCKAKRVNSELKATFILVFLF